MLTEDDLYAIERWVGKFERNNAMTARKRNTPTRIMLDHINTLTAEVRRLWEGTCTRCSVRDVMFGEMDEEPEDPRCGMCDQLPDECPCFLEQVAED